MVIAAEDDKVLVEAAKALVVFERLALGIKVNNQA